MASHQGTSTADRAVDNSKAMGIDHFVTLPQEVIDEIVALALPDRLGIKLHEYHTADAEETSCAIEPRRSWNQTVNLRRLNHEFLAAVDNHLKKIDTVELDVATHPNNGHIWSHDANVPVPTSMHWSEWDATITNVFDIKTLVIKSRSNCSASKWRPKESKESRIQIVLERRDRRWVVANSEWDWDKDTRRRAEKAFEQRKFRGMVEGALRWFVARSSDSCISAPMLSQLQLCLSLDPEDLAEQDWILEKAGRLRNEMAHDRNASMLDKWRREEGKRLQKMEKAAKKMKKGLN